jgi:hypothetical protein
MKTHCGSPAVEKENMAADERRLTQIEQECLSAFIGVHRRPFMLRR